MGSFWACVLNGIFGSWSTLSRYQFYAEELLFLSTTVYLWVWLRGTGEESRGNVAIWGPTNLQEEWLYRMERQEWGAMSAMLRDTFRTPPNISATDTQGYTALHRACMVELQHGQGPHGRSFAPFMDPETGGYPSLELIQLLVEHGADAQCAHAENNSLLKATKRRPPRHALQTKRTGGIFTSGLRAHCFNVPLMQAIALN